MEAGEQRSEGKGDKGTRGKKAKVRRYMDTLTAERLYEIPSGDVSNRRGLILPQPAVIIPHYPLRAISTVRPSRRTTGGRGGWHEGRKRKSTEALLV